MNFLADTFHIFKRHMMSLWRQPVWILVSLVQPIIWLGLFGQLFKKVTEIPGFGASGSGGYIQFLTPGVVVMTGFFGGLWAGMTMIDQLNDGFIDRLLVTPASRESIIAAAVLQSTVTVFIQSAIILLMGMALGARFPGGAGGAIIVLILSSLMASAFAAISYGLAVLLRREETLIAVVNFFGMPLTFLSTAFLAATVMPGWIHSIARYNPVNWAVEGSRFAIAGNQWTTVGIDVLLLVGVLVVFWLIAAQAFKVYQRSL